MVVCVIGLYLQYYSCNKIEESRFCFDEEVEVQSYVWVSFEDGVVGEAERNVVGYGEVLLGLVVKEGYVKEDQDVIYYLVQSWKEEMV